MLVVFGHNPPLPLPFICNHLQSAGTCHKIEEIQSVTINTFQNAWRLNQGAPKDTESAQYSINYQVACAIIYGEVGLKEVLPPLLEDSQVLVLLNKIQIVENKEYTAAHDQLPRKFCADVTILLHGGKELNSGTFQPKWGEDDLPSNAQLQEKFTSLVQPIIGQNKALQLITMICNIIHLKDFAQIIHSSIKD